MLSDLVDVMVTEHSVKQSVEVIEKVDHLDGITEGGDGGETHNVTEVDCHLVKVLWLHCGTGFQSLCHRAEGQKYEIYESYVKICEIKL